MENYQETHPNNAISAQLRLRYVHPTLLPLISNRSVFEQAYLFGLYSQLYYNPFYYGTTEYDLWDTNYNKGVAQAKIGYKKNIACQNYIRR